MHSNDLTIEAGARAAYRLGDHLHEWDDASEGLKDLYRNVVTNILSMSSLTLNATEDEDDE